MGDEGENEREKDKRGKRGGKVERWDKTMEQRLNAKTNVSLRGDLTYQDEEA